MPKVTTILLLFFILLNSCTTSHFSTANNIRNVLGKVYTTDGNILEGVISVSNEGGIGGGREYIRFKPKNGKEEKIPFANFNEISIRGEFYTPKKLESTLLGAGNRLYLVKRITTAASKIQFYEFMQVQQNTNVDGNGNMWNDNSRNIQYLISLPTMDKYSTYNIERRNVVPNFEDKVSAMVQDCPTLADKIKRKEKGYFYAQISMQNNKKLDTWMQIIEEYNGCK